MEAKHKVCEAIYFLHLSFLDDAGKTFISKQQPSVAAKLLFELCMGAIHPELITCDRTIKALNTSKRAIRFTPGIIDMVNEKSLPIHNGLEDIEYAFKVASLHRITTKPDFFLVSDDQKHALQKLAIQKGFSLLIVSASDFS